MLSSGQEFATAITSPRSWRVPSERHPHARTWLAWPWNANIWDNIPGTSLRLAQEAMDQLIRCVANYEDVALLVRDCDAAALERRFAHVGDNRRSIELIITNFNDIWVRDTLPTFAISTGGSLVAVDWNFNGWGRRARQFGPYGEDAQLCKKIASRIRAELMDSGVVAEGGAFVFDEREIVVVTKSVMFDPFRNPGRGKLDIEEAVMDATGRTRVCWLPGDRSEPVTTGHADSMVAFASSGAALINWVADETSAEYDICDYNSRVFKSWIIESGRELEIIKLPALRRSVGIISADRISTSPS